MREKKEEGKIKRDDFIFFCFFLIFNSNEDSSANFWVPFKKKKKKHRLIS